MNKSENYYTPFGVFCQTKKFNPISFTKPFNKTYSNISI